MALQVTFHGTRGSLPVPGRRTVRYGGNTSCVSVRSAAGTLVLLDMGTGAYELGQQLARSDGPVRGHVLITHTHWDHIQGVPFFAPFFRAGDEWDVYAPRGLGKSLRETLSGQMQYTYFPLELEQLGATIRYHDIVEGALHIDDVTVQAQYLNHPALTLGYRLAADGVSLVYAPDHEPFAAPLATGAGPVEGGDRRHAEFLQDADIVVHDAQFLADEYASRAGWGHSTVEYAVLMAKTAGVRRLALTHHDPNRSDDDIDAIVDRFRPLADGVELFAAAEGKAFEVLGAGASTEIRRQASPKATMQPALKGQSVLLSGTDRAGIERLAEILRSDGVPGALCRFSEVPARLMRDRPSLLLIVGGEGHAIRACTREVRSLGEPVGDTPVIVIGDAGEGFSNEELGVSDRLVGPFSANYARTRLRAWLMRRACRWARPLDAAQEERRLGVLHALNIVNTDPDPALDRLVRLGADLFGVPIAAITLVDRDKQWNRAICGLADGAVSREESFCAHIVAQPGMMVVPDTLLDDRFADNPQVVGPPHLRFYAGHPLMMADSHCIGAFCIADIRPRDLDHAGFAHLAQLADLARLRIEAAASVSGG